MLHSRLPRHKQGPRSSSAEGEGIECTWDFYVSVRNTCHWSYYLISCSSKRRVFQSLPFCFGSWQRLSCLPHSTLLHPPKSLSLQTQRRFPLHQTHRNCRRVCVRSVHKFPSQRPFLHHDICIAGPIVCIHLLVSFLEREQTHLALHI
jgi:hypothetical protein